MATPDRAVFTVGPSATTQNDPVSLCQEAIRLTNAGKAKYPSKLKDLLSRLLAQAQNQPVQVFND
jgi:hypothetical protein